jgi:hypothetical protein
VEARPPHRRSAHARRGHPRAPAERAREPRADPDLRELSSGPLQTAELQARLDEPSAGRLYHHLRELLAAGIVTQPRRSVYAVPDRAVIPLLALIACAHDLAS